MARDDAMQALDRETAAEFDRVWQDLVAPLSSFAQPALGRCVEPFSEAMLGRLRPIPVLVRTRSRAAVRLTVPTHGRRPCV